MEIVFITHGNVLSLQFLAPWATYLIIAGSLYGAARLVVLIVQIAGWILGSFAGLSKPPVDRQ